MQLDEIKMYAKFDDLASDLLDLAKEILPEQLFYLSVMSDTQQLILKLSNENASIHITEGMVIELNHSLCNRIDFEKNQPLIYEDVHQDGSLEDLKEALAEANVQSYLGIPICLTNGETFGTLCAINDETSLYDSRSITLLQRIVRMFSYYLELERIVWRDALTELYNRRYLTHYFEQHPAAGGAIFFLDLDGFKQVNDVYGHDTGDSVLQEVALRLKTLIIDQKDAFAVRLGGDEFVLHFPRPCTEELCRQRAENILRSLSNWENYNLSTSIGIVTYTEGNKESLKTLLQHADNALYHAKTSGKNRYKIFE